MVKQIAAILTPMLVRVEWLVLAYFIWINTVYLALLISAYLEMKGPG